MQTFRAYLQLVRFPAVFTAMADVVLGFLLNHRTLKPWDDFGLLLVVSSCLYLAGMAFNDIFDRERDGRHRPERPLPSGRVSLRGAVTLGGLLVLGGIAAAAVVGRQSLLVAGALTVAIFLYDGLLKTTPVAPLLMGACRFLNVMLGATAAETTLAIWTRQHGFVALGLATYIVGVTWFARGETGTSSKAQLAGAIGVINLGLLMILALPVWPLRPSLDPVMTRLAGTPLAVVHAETVLLALLVMALILNRRLVTTLLAPQPRTVQTTVKTLLLSLIVLDATLVYFKTGQPGPAVATAALIVPAVVLGRWIFVT